MTRSRAVLVIGFASGCASACLSMPCPAAEASARPVAEALHAVVVVDGDDAIDLPLGALARRLDLAMTVVRESFAESAITERPRLRAGSNATASLAHGVGGTREGREVHVWIRVQRPARAHDPTLADLWVRDDAGDRVVHRTFEEEGDEGTSARVREATLAVLGSTLDAIRHGVVVGDAIVRRPETTTERPSPPTDEVPKAPPEAARPPSRAWAPRLGIGYGIGSWGSSFVHGPTATVGIDVPFGQHARGQWIFVDATVTYRPTWDVDADGVALSLTALEPRAWGGYRRAIGGSLDVGVYAGGGVDVTWTRTEGEARWQVRPNTRHARATFVTGLVLRLATDARWPSVGLRGGLAVDPDPVVFRVREGDVMRDVASASHVRFESALFVSLP